MPESSTLSDVLTRSPDAMRDVLAGTTLAPAEPLVPQIYRILWDEIVSMRILPGQSISEKEVADVLSASKTPVREALIRLEDAGLVRVVPKSGTYVTPIRLNAYIEACFVRLQLEIGAVRRSASRGRAHRDVAVLDQILAEQERAITEERMADFFALDEQLHRAFFQLAGVPGIWQVLQKTQADVYRVRHLKRINKISRRQEVMGEHIRIVEAIKQGDEHAAEAALVAHIGSLEGELEQLAAHPELLAFIEPGGHQRSMRSPRRSP